MNNRCRTGDLNFPIARTLVHTSRSRGTITPNTTILRVSSVAAATVLSPHWAVEQIDWNKTENITCVKQVYPIHNMCYCLSADGDTHHTDPQHYLCEIYFSSLQWSWLYTPPLARNINTSKKNNWELDQYNLGCQM